MRDWKMKKLWIEQETDQVYTPKNLLFESYKHYTENNLKQQLEWKKFKTVEYIITPTMDHYPRNEYMGDTDPSCDM